MERYFRFNDPQVAAKVMDGEAVVIHLGTGVYYSMDGVACLAWERIAGGQEADALVDDLARRYGVDRATVERDVTRLLDELLAAELVVAADAGQRAPAGDGWAPPSYESPVLRRYDDMAELLALDPPLPAAPC
jgi:hypothetical protein